MKNVRPIAHKGQAPEAVSAQPWVAQTQGLLAVLETPNAHNWPGLHPVHMLDALEGALLRWLMAQESQQTAFQTFMQSFATTAHFVSQPDQLGVGNVAHPTSVHARRVHQRAMELGCESLYQHLLRMAAEFDMQNMAQTLATGLYAYGASHGVGSTLSLDMAWRLSDAMAQPVSKNFAPIFNHPRSHT